MEAIATLTVKRLVRSPEGRSIGDAGIDREDLMMEARLACLIAFRGFDPAYGTSLQTWMIWKARGAVLEGLRRADFWPRGWRAKGESAAHPLVVLSWDEPGMVECLGDLRLRHDPAIDQVLCRVDLERAFAALAGRVDPAARLVATWYLLEGVELQECAKRLRLCDSRTRQLLGEARVVLRAALEGEVLPPVPPRVHDSAWTAPFLRAVARGTGVVIASGIAGVSRTLPTRFARTHPEFAAAFAEAKAAGGALRCGTQWRGPFLARIREGMTTREAAEAVGVHPHSPPTAARKCPAFRAAWEQAKATGRKEAA